ncbi:hypothetical protein GCM10011425_28280 [Mucilaginibacter galii]|uniref:Uncharacterized protein n=1 Tax=Mucilaginibacter galii TaxID=2005073 RepID=A0A917JAG1_9SPHI|nr:hypothetical protein GCM10011425_28280 [Mucilaginibacter galii]
MSNTPPWPSPKGREIKEVVAKQMPLKDAGLPAHPIMSWPCMVAGIALDRPFGSFVAMTKELATRAAKSETN